MRILARLSSSASFLFIVVGGLGAFVTMAVVTADVSLRFFGSSIPGTLEIVTYYLMIMVAFLPLARVEWLESTITVDMLFSAVGAKAQRVILAFASLLSTAVYGLVAYLTWHEALKQFGAGSYVLTDRFPLPTWPAYFFLPLAFGLAAIITLLRIGEIFAGRFPPGPGMTATDGDEPTETLTRDPS